MTAEHLRAAIEQAAGSPVRPLTTPERTAEGAPADFPTLGGAREQEWWAQQASWGLMQVMGAVAREHGFREPFLPQLTDINTGLHYGCKHLAAQLARTRGDVDKALESYNGGFGSIGSAVTQAYVVKVRAHLRGIQGAARRA